MQLQNHLLPQTLDLTALPPILECLGFNFYLHLVMWFLSKSSTQGWFSLKNINSQWSYFSLNKNCLHQSTYCTHNLRVQPLKFYCQKVSNYSSAICTAPLAPQLNKQLYSVMYILQLAWRKSCGRNFQVSLGTWSYSLDSKPLTILCVWKVHYILLTETVLVDCCFPTASQPTVIPKSEVIRCTTKWFKKSTL